MTEPTPRPWVLSPQRKYIRRTLHGYNIASVNDHCDEYEANARLIVHAVNCHDELVGALIDLLWEIDNNVREHHANVLRRARTILAKARTQSEPGE